MRSKFSSFGFAVPILLISPQSLAHHSASLFDQDRDITIRGTVTRFSWANPHVYIEIDAKDADGNMVGWVIEAQTPSGMSREGWSANTLEPGDEITVVANPAKNPQRLMALGHSVVRGDGSFLHIPQVRSRRAPTPVDPPTPIVADGLSGRWVTRWNPDVAFGFLRARELWPLTDKGVAAMDSYNSSLNPGNDCVPEPVPYVMIWPTGKSIEIGETVTVIRDELGVDRKVYMTVSTHEGADNAIEGHSIGSWDDGVLVVDTTHFIPHRRGLAVGGLPSGERKHVIERFELGPDRSTLLYTFVLEDSDYLSAPVNGMLELAYRPDRPFVSEPCDLESARRYLGE